MRIRKFMTHKGHAIYYKPYMDCDEEVPAYAVAKGDGTDEYFRSWEDAMDWIEEIESKKK